MDALTIFKHILKLEKENAQLREENDKLRAAIAYLHTVDDDAASVDGTIHEDSDSDSEASVNQEDSEEEESEEEEESPNQEDSEEDDDTDYEEDEPDFVYEDQNDELSGLFTRLAAKETDHFKKNAYTHAAQVIKDLHFKPTCGKQLMSIPGIGRGIAKLVDEYVATGTFKKAE